MDRTIPPIGYLNKPRRLDSMARHCLHCPQQSEECHHKLSPNQILIGYERDLLPVETPPLNNKATENRIKTLMENHAIATNVIN
jgi:hypothetical protein